MTGNEPENKPPIRLFYSYAHEDEGLRQRLEKHLRVLHWNGLIAEWHDRMIGAGEDWENAIDANLETADVILLLLSSSFLSSSYCWSKEMAKALERHARKEARVIPVILRPCQWRLSPLAKLQALPKDAKAVTTWANEDEAFDDVAARIVTVVGELQRAQASATVAAPPKASVSPSAASGSGDDQPLLPAGTKGAFTSELALEMPNQPRRKYDVVLSYAGEDRAYAEQLAQALMNLKVDVFYDQYEKAHLWGKNLYDHLSDVYQNRGRYCVILISKYYASKVWTNHERKSAQARAFHENDDYILPVRLDDTEIAGVLPTVGYLRWQTETPASIAEAVAAKLGETRAQPASAARPKLAVPHGPSRPMDWSQLQPFHFESFDGPTSGLWAPFREEKWTADLRDGKYVLSNYTDRVAVKYLYFQINNEDMSHCAISIDVMSALREPPSLAGAGLIYRFNRKTNNYYAFTLRYDKYIFSCRQDGSYRPLFSGRITGLDSNCLNTIAMFGKASTFQLYVNGQLVRIIENADIDSGDVGIIAMGMGDFFFDDLAVYRMDG